MNRPDTLLASPFRSPPDPERGAGAIVVIPTYNEIENIATVLERVLALEDDIAILVVDDGSEDGTAEAVETFVDRHPARIGLLQRGAKYGLGTAYLDGFAHALRLGFECICEMDADLSHNPNDLPKLIQACLDGADVAIGSRYIGGVRVVNWPLQRLVLSYGAGVYTRLITRLPVKDVTAGFTCYRRDVLQAINLSRVRSNGYSFQIEMKFRAWKAGFELVEIPVVFTERTEGQSKMTKAIVREAALKVWQFRFLSLFGKL